MYTTAPLDRDIEVTGEIVARLYVATTVPSTDFTAKLVHVHPNGAAYNVTDGLLRRRYTPQLDPDRSAPELIVVRYRNLNSGEPAASATRAVLAMQAVHHGPESASALVLPIVP